jgi:hypothetical protein
MAHAPLERTHDSSPNGVDNPDGPVDNSGGGMQTSGIFVPFVDDVLCSPRCQTVAFARRRHTDVQGATAAPRNIREKRSNTARTARESDAEDRFSGKIRRNNFHRFHPRLCSMSCQES